MKNKFLLIITVAVFGAMVSTSCEPKENSVKEFNRADIVGIWLLTNDCHIEKENGQIVDQNDTDVDNVPVTFNDDGSATFISYGNDGIGQTDAGEDIRWDFSDGNKIHIYWADEEEQGGNDGDFIFEIDELTATGLVMSSIVEEEDDWVHIWRMTFTKSE
jgi:hypothetical protein